MEVRIKIKRVICLTLSMLVMCTFFSNMFANNVFSANTKKASFKLKMYAYTPNADSNLAGTIGNEITSLYPGQQFLVAISLQEFNDATLGYEGIAGLESALKYDSGVVEYIGIPNAGVNNDPVGGNSIEVNKKTKDIFDLSLRDAATNSRLKYANNFYENILVEYPTSTDHTGANPKIRSVRTASYYKGNIFEDSKIFKSTNAISDNNNIATLLFKVKDNPVQTAGHNTFAMDEDSLTISYYTTKDLIKANYLSSGIAGDNYIYNKVEKPTPIDPAIGFQPEGITDTIDHDNGTRTVTVDRLTGLQNVPTGTKIKVYAPDGTFLGEKTATANGPVTVDLPRGSDKINSLLNLGGDYKVSATVNGSEGIKVNHTVIARENYIKSDKNIPGILAEVDVGADLTSLPKDVKDVAITYDPVTGLETPAPYADLTVAGWTFVDPNDTTDTLGVKKVQALFLDKGNIKNKHNYKALSEVEVKYLPSSIAKISLGAGNALPEDISSGEADASTIYNYYGYGFRDDFVATDRNGRNVTDKVTRTVKLNGTSNDLGIFNPNESLTFFSDNAGDLKSFVKKEFRIHYSYTDIDGRVLEAERKVFLIHRLGDVNRDGIIDIKDRDAIRTYVLGLGKIADISDTSYFKYILDTDRNAVADLSDAAIINQVDMYSHLIPQYYTFVAKDENVNPPVMKP